MIKIMGIAALIALNAQASGRSVEKLVKGEDWFFQSNACEKAKSNVRGELESECRFYGAGPLQSYESKDCSCVENSSQPRFVCTVEATGVCQ
jgi:hypothetical protein